MQKLTQRLTIAVFALVLLGFMVLHLLLPDGTSSRAERRKLQQFPEVSGEALLSAEFSEDVEDYLLDQFPFRDSFRSFMKLFQCSFALRDSRLSHLPVGKSDEVSRLSITIARCR